MRWEQQRVAFDDQGRLPGYGDVIVRHFDAPEAIDTRFYEVRAKSILNRVPEASRMPFRWTINPYRGCTHACAYCVWGGTAILMGDGRHRPIERVQIGDSIYGSVRGGRYRRFALTEVLAKSISIKPAVRVLLADGTELIASGDHRFLTNRGWKYVLNSPSGAQDRPHLTLTNHLIGTGHFADQAAETSAYRRGYLCGVIRGDGHIGEYSYGHTFRLALADLEALRRARAYLLTERVETNRRVFAAASGSRRAMEAISIGRRQSVDAIRELIAWPAIPSEDWCRGFLAGIFDAEGSRSDFALRIANTDPEIIGWIESAAHRLRFETTRDVATGPGKNLTCIRIRGGLVEHMRFFHLTDPAITRKRSIAGQMVKTFADLRVVSIEPLRCKLPLYDITTGTGDFIANGVISHNCFARPTHEYLDFNAGRDFEREIVVKVNAPERLRAELTRRSWQREHVALGTNTDPYQWAEGRYQLMPEIWKAFRDARNPCSILTKSPLLLRDLGLMRELDSVTDFSAALSIPTLDRSAWRATEPRSPNPRARVEAVAELTRAGIRTGVLVAPLMPGINDAPEQVEEVVRLACEAGASYIIGIPLHLRGSVREVFMTWLAENRPDLVDTYEELYRRRAYLPAAEQQRIAKLVDAAQLSAGPPPGRILRDRGFGNGARRSPMRGGESRAETGDGAGSDPRGTPDAEPPRLF